MHFKVLRQTVTLVLNSTQRGWDDNNINDDVNININNHNDDDDE